MPVAVGTDGVLSNRGIRMEVRWPTWTPVVIGGFVLTLVGAVGLQRHVFTHPSWAALALAIVALPWVLDMTRLCHLLMDRWPYPTMIAWSMMVLGGVIWLSVVYPTQSDFAPFFIVFLVGQMTSMAGPRFGLIIAVFCSAAVVGLEASGLVSGSVVWLFAIAITWLGGSAFRWQMRASQQLEDAQLELAERAVEEERHRLARDIHDLIAHSLAVTMLHLSGARLALKDGETSEALEALEDAEKAGRSALAEIHRTVGLLGSAGSNGTRVPTPSAVDLGDLVGGFRTAGLAVDFNLSGDLEAVPLATGLAAYRIVQESLSNAVKHAPGVPVGLAVEVTAQEISIEVENPLSVGAPSPFPPGSGLGLRGMVERAELLGGTAVAGNTERTWRVKAVLPWTRVSA